MLAPRALAKVVPTLNGTARRGPWYRAVNHDHLLAPPPGTPSGSAVQPLWPGGAALKGARFTPHAPPGTVGIDCLYLAEDELTPLMEVAGVLRPPGSPVPLLFEPHVLMTVDGVLGDVLDLTDLSLRAALGTTHQELTGAWQVQQAAYLAGQAPMPPTHVLAQAAFAAGTVVALRYPSSKNPSGVGLVVFTSRLHHGRHSLAVFNRKGGALQQSLP
jgi:hypothetical protein